jgi:hypothetical protein
MKHSTIKYILIVLTCLLLSFTNVSSDETAASSKGAGTSNKEQQPDLIPDISSDSATPDQIKAFLSKPREDNYIILNFDNADLKDVINTVGSITNENFILSPGLDARITIHSAKKIPVSEVMNVFESVLEAMFLNLY